MQHHSLCSQHKLVGVYGAGYTTTIDALKALALADGTWVTLSGVRSTGATRPIGPHCTPHRTPASRI
jgi:hypothetical protein